MEAVEATPEVIKLGRQSIPLWRNIRGRLKTPTMMQENGSLIVWHGQDKPLSSEFVRHLKRGGVADDEIVRWRADDIAKREPQLGGRFSDGIYLPTEGQLDGRQILSALADALDELNVPCHWEHEYMSVMLCGSRVGLPEDPGTVLENYEIGRASCRERV